MPQKITSREVCRKIIEQRRDALESIVSRAATVQYTRAMFAEDMAANDFISTRATIASKWSTLIADGIVARGGRRTELDIRMLYIRAGVPLPKESESRPGMVAEVSE